LPFHEAIIDELKEAGYNRAIHYLKKIYELDEEYQNKVPMRKKPRLRDNRDALLRLKEGLIVFEQAEGAREELRDRF